MVPRFATRSHARRLTPRRRRLQRQLTASLRGGARGAGVPSPAAAGSASEHGLWSSSPLRRDTSARRSPPRVLAASRCVRAIVLCLAGVHTQRAPRRAVVGVKHGRDQLQSAPSTAAKYAQWRRKIASARHRAVPLTVMCHRGALGLNAIRRVVVAFISGAGARSGSLCTVVHYALCWSIFAFAKDRGSSPVPWTVS